MPFSSKSKPSSVRTRNAKRPVAFNLPPPAGDCDGGVKAPRDGPRFWGADGQRGEGNWRCSCLKSNGKAASCALLGSHGGDGEGSAGLPDGQEVTAWPGHPLILLGTLRQEQVPGLGQELAPQLGRTALGSLKAAWKKILVLQGGSA